AAVAVAVDAHPRCHRQRALCRRCSIDDGPCCLSRRRLLCCLAGRPQGEVAVGAVVDGRRGPAVVVAGPTILGRADPDAASAPPWCAPGRWASADEAAACA
ncbi:hypothetical protein Vafri_15137, partial [Volvox africanus]